MDSDVADVKGEKKMGKDILTRLRLARRLSDRFYLPKSVHKSPEYHNNTPQNDDLFWFSIDYFNINQSVT